MRDTARSFLIDLVAISSHLRITVFKGQKVHMTDLVKVTCLTADRIEDVLVKALTTDFRDQQLELLASQIVFSDANEHARRAKEVRAYEAPYPPLRIVEALTNTNLDTLKKYHESPLSRSLIRAFIDTQFTQPVFEWVESNVDNALNVGMEDLAYTNYATPRNCQAA